MQLWHGNKKCFHSAKPHCYVCVSRLASDGQHVHGVRRQAKAMALEVKNLMQWCRGTQVMGFPNYSIMTCDLSISLSHLLLIPKSELVGSTPPKKNNIAAEEVMLGRVLSFCDRSPVRGEASKHQGCILWGWNSRMQNCPWIAFGPSFWGVWGKKSTL